jgi:hypothetical protein
LLGVRNVLHQKSEPIQFRGRRATVPDANSRTILFEGRNAPSVQPYQNAQIVHGFMDHGKNLACSGVRQPDGKQAQIEVLQQNERNAADRTKP